MSTACAPVPSSINPSPATHGTGTALSSVGGFGDVQYAHAGSVERGPSGEAVTIVYVTIALGFASAGSAITASTRGSSMIARR